MNQTKYTLQQLVSSEILFEIQASFLKKYGLAVCVYDFSSQPLLSFPLSLPALANLSDDQRSLFAGLISPASFDVDLSFPNQKQIVQSFAQSTIYRILLPIYFADEYMGFAALIQLTKTIEANRDEQLLLALSRIAQQKTALHSIQDKNSVFPSSEMQLYTQELQNILQLFLEAGKARAHITHQETATQEIESPVLAGLIGILFCAPNGHIVDSTPGVADFLGYDEPGDLCDLNFFNDLLATDYDREKIRMLFPVDSSIKTSAALSLSDGTSLPVDIQLFIQRTSASVIGFECHLLTAADTQIQEAGSMSSLSEPVISYDEKRLADLQDIYRPMQNLLAHLIAPLAQRLKVMSATVVDPSAKKELAVINRLITSLSTINHQLACFTRRKVPERKQVSMNRLIDHVSRQLKKILPGTISIETILDDRIDMLSINPELIVHAVGSLCKNAVEAMPHGGRLYLETRASDFEMISIIIRDTGIGLTESVRTHLFEPFFSSKSRIGAGLGLSAAYGIVKSHGGSISITDTPGQGVSVTISLPVMQAAQRDEMQPKGYVLIVDDEQEIAEATAMTLRREGYAVFTSTSCQDAFRLFEQVGAKIDLIILDNQLGSTKGTSCAQELLSRAPHLPILFYSGADDDLELMAFIKSIGAGWLKKPFSSHELLSHINSLIVKKQVPA